jgi:hypothetical protein
LFDASWQRYFCAANSFLFSEGFAYAKNPAAETPTFAPAIF